MKVVRATIRPDNVASLAVIRRGHLAHVGEQWDEADGLELVYEGKSKPPTAERAQQRLSQPIQTAGEF